ncbi:MAG: molecular chaperone DnaJ [Blastocatellia bacterium]|nr:molecular chaperone DnaJ [Blastocatellia bacterium]
MWLLHFEILETTLVDYYKILGIKQTASAVEIKSAYRRLARERHPDVNRGSKRAARDFAIIAIAYRTLGDSKKRANYDAQRERLRQIASSPVSVSNPFLQRMRTVAAQARMDREIDELFAADRLDNLAFQEAVYPTVALFVFAFLAPILRPKFWQEFATPGRVLIATLFGIALWHIWRRLLKCMSRYNITVDLNVTDTAQVAPPHKTYSRIKIISFLIGGVALCSLVGLFVGEHSQYIILQASPFFFDSKIHPELFLYPPIAVLVVDLVHTLALKIDL